MRYTPEEETKIILPQAAFTEYDSQDKISNGLRYLTRILIGEKAPLLGLGGAYGYGTDFESNIFMMHPYCWCDKDDCPWCAGCQCPESAYHYYIDGKETSYEEWLKFYTDRVPGVWYPNWEEISNEVNKHRSTKHFPVCDFCLKSNSRYGSEPGKAAPNFWHKKTNFKVWWYKWIGRSMKISNPNNIEFTSLLNDCIKSLR